LLKKRVLSHSLERPEAFSGIITRNEKMRSIFQYVEAIAGTNQPVLITGETGVGKELMAKAINKLSQVTGEFVAVNVSGLDDTLFADTLFGHIKGAYTGAEQSRKGLVEKATDGTLFLDEIGDLSLLSQIKLLRLIQEREYLPIGTDLVKNAAARIIVATNQDLNHRMKSGRFRKDLFYRLQTHRVHIPPLRQRVDDIPLLVEHFLKQSAQTLGKKSPTPPPELFTLLAAYQFPGNIRELQSLVFDAVSKHKSRKLSMEVFKTRIFQDISSDALNVEPDLSTDIPPLSFSPVNLPTIKQTTRLLICEAMKRADGNQSIAARFLGISQQALSRRLKSLEK